jgi:hypothetical protein
MQIRVNIFRKLATSPSKTGKFNPGGWDFDLNAQKVQAYRLKIKASINTDDNFNFFTMLLYIFKKIVCSLQNLRSCLWCGNPRNIWKRGPHHRADTSTQCPSRSRAWRLLAGFPEWNVCQSQYCIIGQMSPWHFVFGRRPTLYKGTLH